MGKNDIELVIFAHLQRTGGNSLRELLAANLGAANTVRGTKDTIGSFIQRAEAGRVRAVEGLFRYGVHEYLCPRGQFRYFTFIRDPLARWASYYNFCHVHTSAGLRDLALSHSFVDFLKHAKRPRNAAAQVLCGFNSAPQMDTLPALMQRFALIGLQERFVESVFLLCRIFGFSFPFAGYVGRLTGSRAESPDAEAANIIAELDAVDCRLQEEARGRMDLCIERLNARDREMLNLFREATEATGGDPELAGLLEQVRRAGVPAARSVESLRKQLRSLPRVSRGWGKKIGKLLDYFESVAAAPDLWLSSSQTPSPPAPAPLAAERSLQMEAIRLKGEAANLDQRRFSLEVESVTALPERATFLEHHQRQGQSEVVAGKGGYLWVSYDLGDTWQTLRLQGATSRVIRCFTTFQGIRMLQFHGDSRVHVYDLTGRLVRVSGDAKGNVQWHGSWSIDQSLTGTVCWAEYVPRADIVTVHRSIDLGENWLPILEVEGRMGLPNSIRHFHMVLADPFEPGRWYLTSGDRGEECQFWISGDDGATWQAIGPPHILNPQGIGLGPKPSQIYRATAAVIGRDWIYWSTDDPMDGNGPVYVRMAKSPPHTVEVLGRVGMQHTRALIQHSDRHFIAISQGNRGSDHVAVHLLSKKGEIIELLRLPKPPEQRTSFCKAMSSLFTDKGVFFTAGGGNVLDPGPRLWRWHVKHT